MEVGEAQRMLGAVTAIDVAVADRAEVTAGVRDLRRLQSFLEGRAVAFARRLAEVSPCPEQVMAEAGLSSTRDAEKVLERAGVTGQVAVFGAALDAGTVSAAHVDAVGRGLKSLDPDLRSLLVDAADRLLGVAEVSSPVELDRR